jgi:hypothetical protein
MFEEQMIDKVRNFIEDYGFHPYYQIPFFYGKIDFVGINDDECMVIETKIDKWKMALKQALYYGYGAEYSYIALPEKIAYYVSNSYMKVFKTYKVGLLAVDLSGREKTKILISSFKNDFSPVFKDNILYEIKKRKKESEIRIKEFKRRYDI